MHADDDLSPGERAALAALAREISLPRGLEDRAAVAVAGALRSRRRRSLAVRGLLAAVLTGAVFAAGLGLGEQRARTAAGAPGARFLLVLREGAAFHPPATLSQAALVQEYSVWAHQLGNEGRLELGEKLADAGWLLGAEERSSPPTGDGVIAGLFIVRAASEAQALEIGRTCPHLRYGGVVEVRRIVET